MTLTDSAQDRPRRTVLVSMVQVWWNVPGLKLGLAGTFAAAAGSSLLAEKPTLLILLSLLFLGIGIGLYKPQALERAGIIVLVGGVLVLGYGFANLGVSGAIPVPLAEMILLPLVFVALVSPEQKPEFSILLPLGLYIGVVAIRLAFFDYVEYGILAVRDASMAVEALSLVLGYHALSRFGMHWWIRAFGVILGCALLYASFFPLDLLGNAGPTVGLNRNVRLFGTTGIGYAVAAASLYFIVFLRGWRRVVLLGMALAVLAVFQQRSLYILMPFSLLVLAWSLRRPAKVMLNAVAAVSLTVIVVSLISAAGVQGRVGPVSIGFIGSHARTLLGEEGPSKGTIEGREKWIERTLNEVTRSPATILLGVGLGPDLANVEQRTTLGHNRKPHNDYLEVFARTGLVGLAVFLALIGTCYRRILRALRVLTGKKRELLSWILAASIIYLGVAAVQPLLSFSYGAIPFFFWLGMGLAIAKDGSKQFL